MLVVVAARPDSKSRRLQIDLDVQEPPSVVQYHLIPLADEGVKKTRFDLELLPYVVQYVGRVL